MKQNNPALIENRPSILRSRSREVSSRGLFVLLGLSLAACGASAQTLTTLHNFGSAPHDGLAPGSGVIMDPKGNLFGTTGIGGDANSDGTVFELSLPATADGLWTETILHRFHGMPDGKDPLSRLVMTSDGSLFGTTLRGGGNDQGTAYTITPVDGKGMRAEKPIYDFGSVAFDVISPDLGFLVASGGPDCDPIRRTANCEDNDWRTQDADNQRLPEVLYGVDQGGVNGTGAVYLLTPPRKRKSWTETILYNFGPFQSGDGFGPAGELVRDARGNLYGVTAQGGANNLGALYKVSPPTAEGKPWTESVLYSFDLADGWLPSGKLLFGKAGQLYGTTDAGGSNDGGTVYELDPPRLAGGPWTHRVIYAFTGGADGGSPGNGVIMDAKGRLFGTASDVIFMLTPPPASAGAWQETVLHSFTGPDGFTAITPLTLFKNALYGTTEQAGGSGAGTVFQLTLP